MISRKRPVLGFTRSHVFTVLGALLVSGLLTSCGPKEADKIGEAQLCIDNAPQGMATACLSKISGIESKAANALRCSVGFIDEGFTEPTRFKTAFDQLSAGGSSNTQAFMSVLSFRSKATLDLNVTYATDTYNYCVKSEGKGFMLLGSMANTATNLAKVASVVNPSSADIQTAITNLVASPTSPTNAPVVAAVGGAISATYTASCKTGTQADASLCTQLDTALAGVNLADSAAVGLQVLNYWKTH